MNGLSDDVILEILRFVDSPRSVLAFACASKRCSELADDNLVWHALWDRYFGPLSAVLEVHGELDWDPPPAAPDGGSLQCWRDVVMVWLRKGASNRTAFGQVGANPWLLHWFEWRLYENPDSFIADSVEPIRPGVDEEDVVVREVALLLKADMAARPINPPTHAESRDCRTVQQMAGATAALPGYGIAFDGLMHTKLTPVVAGVDGRGCRLWPWGENGVRVSAGEAEAGAGVWHRLDTVPMAWWMELQPSEVFDLLVAASPRLVADNVVKLPGRGEFVTWAERRLAVRPVSDSLVVGSVGRCKLESKVLLASSDMIAASIRGSIAKVERAIAVGEAAEWDSRSLSAALMAVNAPVMVAVQGQPLRALQELASVDYFGCEAAVRSHVLLHCRFLAMVGTLIAELGRIIEGLADDDALKQMAALIVNMTETLSNVRVHLVDIVCELGLGLAEEEVAAALEMPSFEMPSF